MPDAEDAPVLWVTGAGSGVGRAVAESAARDGWRIALTGRRPEMLDEVARGIDDAGGEALALPGDVGDGASVSAMRDSVLRRWGRIDGLVLAAGLNRPRRTWPDQDMREFTAIVQTNLVAVALVVDAALPALRRRGGTVVVVSSYAAWTFSPGAGVAYSASKSALAAVCRTLNVQEAASGIRATHLCPGDVDTDFLAQRPQVPDTDARAVMLTADDVARTVRFVLDGPPHVRIDELVVSPLSQR